MNDKHTLTLADIARLANVSKSTASRALNDNPLIKVETRERIKEIARQKNFSINAPARRLSLKQSRTIAFVTLCYEEVSSIAELFEMEMMGSVSRALHAHGYDMLLVYVNPRESDWVHQYLDSGRVDGFVLMPFGLKKLHIRTLIENKAPFIIWGMPKPGCNCSSVTGDNMNGGKLATEYLIRSGKQKIAFLGGPANDLEVQQRFAGYEFALNEAGRPVDPRLQIYGDYSMESGVEAMKTLLTRVPDLDAVFINSDLMAISAMDALRESGRRIPEDVAVVGYDDLSIAAHSFPALTTIRQNVPLAGKLLAENLIQYLANQVITNVTIPVELVIRKSA